MSTTYSAISGDTFVSIARKVYGDDREAPRLVAANPGVTEPITAGWLVTVPDIPGAPKDRPQPGVDAAENEVAITIAGKRFRFWDTVVVTRHLDTVATFELSAPFDHTAPGFREAFRPLSFPGVGVSVGGSALFTGTGVQITPELTGEKKALALSGYSLPGVLMDCNPSPAKYPIEFNGVDLRGIATSLADPFGIEVRFESDPGAPFDRVECKPTAKIFEFLTGLAKQRGLVIGSSPDGALLFRRVETGGAPVAALKQGESPVLDVKPVFNPQEFYRSITGIEPATTGTKGAQHTSRNIQLRGIVRPHVFEVNTAKGGTVREAVHAKARRMFANAATYAVTVSTWRDSHGDLWDPGALVSLEAPDAMVYSPYEFMLRSVSLRRDSTKETATLQLVFPGVFSDRLPESMPWD